MSATDLLERDAHTTMTFSCAVTPTASVAQQPQESLTSRLDGEASARIATPPAFTNGVVTLRGAIVPFSDMRIKLGSERRMLIFVDTGKLMPGTETDLVDRILQ